MHSSSDQDKVKSGELLNTFISRQNTNQKNDKRMLTFTGTGSSSITEQFDHHDSMRLLKKDTLIQENMIEDA